MDRSDVDNVVGATAAVATAAASRKMYLMTGPIGPPHRRHTSPFRTRHVTNTVRQRPHTGSYAHTANQCVCKVTGCTFRLKFRQSDFVTVLDWHAVAFPNLDVVHERAVTTANTKPVQLYEHPRSTERLRHTHRPPNHQTPRQKPGARRQRASPSPHLSSCNAGPASPILFNRQ